VCVLRVSNIYIEIQVCIGDAGDEDCCKIIEVLVVVLNEILVGDLSNNGKDAA